jgi:two-component system phosphate regulon sensor histidine kinase PhoR
MYINKNKHDFKKAEEEVEEWAKEKKTEIQQLRANEEFRKEFIGNLAHELKTPIFSTQGYILTLLEGGLEDETINLKFLQKASKNIDRISEIIKDMDIITRIESNNLSLEFAHVDLVDLIETIFEELEDRAIKKGIKLKLKKKPVNEIYVLVDKQKITQVFTNLILNSIFYGKKGGETEVILSEKKGKINIEIKDNGIGIGEEHIPRLFERFYRAEKSRDRNKGGSGIGLAIVKHVIEAHNETVEVISKKGIGTSFLFALKKG